MTLVRTMLLLSLLMLTPAFTGCGQREAGHIRYTGNPRSAAATTAKTRTKTKESVYGRRIVVLIDLTNSFSSLRQSLSRLREFVLVELRSGDWFCCLPIADRIEDVPQFIIKPVELPLPVRHIGDPALAESLSIQKRIAAEFATLARAKQYRKTVETDIGAPLTLATRLLRVGGASDARSCWLLIFSDLEPTRDAGGKWDLKRVNVRAFHVPTRGSVAILETKMREWENRFKQAGAASVALFDTGQTMSIANLLN